MSNGPKSAKVNVISCLSYSDPNVRRMATTGVWVPTHAVYKDDSGAVMHAELRSEMA